MSNINTACTTCHWPFSRHGKEYPHACPGKPYDCFTSPVMQDVYDFIEGDDKATDAYGLLRLALAFLKGRLAPYPGHGTDQSLYGEDIADVMAWVHDAAAKRGMLK